MEWVMKALLHWVLDIAIEAIAHPVLSDGFLMQAVEDALGGAKEWAFGPVPGLTRVDASVMAIAVACRQPGALALHAPPWQTATAGATAAMGSLRNGCRCLRLVLPRAAGGC